jgi:hypothetical protein
MTYALKPPTLARFASVRVEVDTPINIGSTPDGHRRVVPIRGGTAWGDGWTGSVLDAGADFQKYPDPSTAILSANYVIEVDSGDLLLVENLALRTADPVVLERMMNGHEVSAEQVYFRCTPRIAADEKSSFAWVNTVLFVGTGVRKPDCVLLDFFSIG